MKITLLDANTLGVDTDLSPLQNVGEVVIFDATAPERMAERIKDTEVIITNKIKLNRNTLAGAEKLKLICVTATGYDNVDTEYCREKGIGLCNVPGYSTQSVAQLTLAMVLSLATHLGEYRDYVHSGRYTASGVGNCLTPVWHELAGKTWGIVGCGNIGRQIAAVAKIMDCRVLVFRRDSDPDYETVELERLLEESDIITVHLPLSSSTRGILSRERIGRIKPGAILVNTARGALADEAALAEAVQEGRLGGLGIDVYSTEPFPPDHPYQAILNDPNVILTPHCAWGSREARNRCICNVAENIAAYAEGQKKNRIC